MESEGERVPEPVELPETQTLSISIGKNKDFMIVYEQKRKYDNNTIMRTILLKSSSVEVPKPNHMELDKEVVEEETSTNDLDLPIAVRKQPRSCTHHPIKKYVCYNAFLHGIVHLLLTLTV